MDFINRDVAFRASDGDGDSNTGRRLEGYAAVYDTDCEIRSWEGTFLERISFGAFRKTLRENPNVMMQWDHGRDSRVGSTPIGAYDTMKEEKGKGLFVAGDLFDNPVVEPVRQAIEAGAVTGMSISMQVMRDEWRDAKGKLIKPDELRGLLWADPSDPALSGRLPLKRNIKELKLGEAGPVGRPAYKTTSVGVRSAEEMEEAERDQLLASYRKTMHYEETRQEDDEVQEVVDGMRLEDWLSAEERYNTDYQLWLDAESAHNESVRSWLDAEEEYRKLHTSEEPPSAVRKHTLWEANRNSPEDADRKVTSERDGSANKSNHQKEVRGMTLQELRARLAEIEKRQGEIDTEFRDAALPEDVDKEWDSLDSEESTVRSQIEKIEKRAAKVIDTVENRSTEDTTERGGPAFHKNDDIYDIEDLQKRSYSGEDFIARATDNARKAIERSVLPSVRGSDDAKSKEYLDSLLSQDEENGWLAKRTLVTGTKIYERAFSKAMRFGTKDVLTMEERQAVERAIAISPTSAGGLAVPIQLDPTLVHLDAAGGYISPIRQLAKIVTLTGRDYTTLTITKVDAVRAGEAAAAAASSPTLAEQKTNVTKVHTFVPFSMEADEDWASLRSEVFQLIAEAKAREEAASFLFGVGTGETPQGLFTGTTNTVQVAGAAGAGTLTFADIQALQDALPVEYELGGNASFVTSKQEVSRLRSIPGTAGGSATFQDLRGPNANELLDTPIYRVAGTGLGSSKSATAGQKFLLYGDIRRAYTILDRVGMDIELLPMLWSANVPAVDTPTGVLPTGQRGFYAHWRNYGKVVDAAAVRALVTK